MKKSSGRSPLWLPDCERIFRTIHGVLLNEQRDLTHACVYFGTIGTALLRNFYGMDAHVKVGAAGYGLGSQLDDVLVFGKSQPSGIISDDDGFHCWVEVNGWAIDFQAPLFRELVASAGHTDLPERIMIQRPLSLAVATSIELQRGRFWYKPNAGLQLSILEYHNSKRANADFEDICVQWFCRPPKKMVEPIGIANQHGMVNPVLLSPIRVTKAW